MISQDGIEAMRDEDIEAAYEAARRGLKGLPEDRLYDGSAGAQKLWRGIIKLGVIIADQTETIAEYQRIELERGQDAMQLHSADSKYRDAG